MNCIRLKNLRKEFSVKKKDEGLKASFKALFQRNYTTIEAVKDISFDIKQGELVGFIGPNGAGKTTTLKMLSGILYPTSGEISVLGFNPAKRKEEFLKQITLVMGQKEQLWSDLPAIDTFKLNKEIYDVSDKMYKEVLDSLIEIFELKEVVNQQVRKLSLGQRMKCEIAASLIHTPKVVFLDEPTIGLDVVMQRKLREFIRKYNKEYKATVILTSHYMDDIVEVCKRVILINKGEVVFDNDIDNLIKRYGKKKQLVVYSKKADDEVFEKNIRRYGELIEVDHSKYTIQVERENATKIAADIFNRLEVNDVDIKDPDLEDIIVKIYEEN